MWTANLEDGTSRCSLDCYWTSLPKDKRLTGVQLTHPKWCQKDRTPRLHLCLKGMDQYFFSRHAVAMMGGQVATEAESIGGVDHTLGVITEIRLDHTGSVMVTTYPLSAFGYDQYILHPGVGKRSIPLPTNGKVQSESLEA